MVIALAVIVGIALFMGGKAVSSENTIDPFYHWDSLIQRYAKVSGVPWTWVKAIMMNESNLGRAASVRHGLENPSDIDRSKSSDGKSWGLMQLTLPTARMFESAITEAGLNDPEISVRIACKYLAYLMKLKNGNQEAVIRSYNGGPGYLTTQQGRNLTPAYYERFKANLKIVENSIKV